MGNNVAWLLYATDSMIRAGNEGYNDEIATSYSWDSTVPRHDELQAGDIVVLWDGRQLLGISVVNRITKAKSTKPR